MAVFIVAKNPLVLVLLLRSLFCSDKTLAGGVHRNAQTLMMENKMIDKLLRTAFRDFNIDI